MEINLNWPIEIEQYERKIYDLKQLIEISKGLNSTLDYNTLIDSILLTCMGQMQLLNAGIFLKKGIGYNDFTLHRNYKGFDIDHSREYELIGDSETIRFLEGEHRCYALDELCDEVEADYTLSILKMLSPSLILPLMCKGLLNGIIILGDRINGEGFLEVEKEYLLNIGSLAGIAIHNAGLYEMATTDMMTGLKIHHFFQNILAEEYERAVKLKRPLTLLMADIDHFKNFNDEHGHAAGDLVLKSVAGILKESIRLMDTAARYGGEEFAVILPKTDIHDAIIVAERIRHGVEENSVYYSHKELNVQISIGIAQLDTEIDTGKDSLIERADRALYTSKRNGRNRVSFL